MPELNVIKTKNNASISCVNNGRVSIASIDNLQDGRWWISRVNIQGTEKGKGLGSIMLKRAIKEVLSFGQTEIIVAPGGYDNNLNRQINFYKKNGFEITNKEGLMTYKKTDTIVKEKYLNEMYNAINNCIGKTAYTDVQIEKMKSDGEKIFNEIFSIDGTTVIFDDNGKEKEVKIEIKKYVFGHNDFKIHCSDYLIKKAMKEIFHELKKEDKELEIKSKIGHQGTNGYGTAFVLSYDLK